jgi:hypothetical protein
MNNRMQRRIYTYKNQAGVTIHPPVSIYEHLGKPDFIEFVLEKDGTVRMVPRRLV